MTDNLAIKLSLYNGQNVYGGFVWLLAEQSGRNQDGAEGGVVVVASVFAVLCGPLQVLINGQYRRQAGRQDS
jgi:hypothetical protein